MEKKTLLKKGTAFAVILLFMGMSVIPSTGTMIVKESTMPTFYDGNTLYVGGSGPGNYSTIQEAIDNASGGDTVFVYDDSSPYYENVVVDKSINLIGENKESTVIDGGESGSVIFISADWTNITGFTIRNSGWNEWNEDSGIHIRGNHSKIIRNILFNNLWGIWARFYSNTWIIENIIIENWYGIYLWTSLHNNITKNNFSNNNVGVELIYYSDYNVIFGNTIKNSQAHGISLYRSSNNDVIENNITDNGFDGIRVWLHCDNNIFSGNYITENAGDGIILYNSSYNNISLNHLIKNCFCGLNLYVACNNNSIFGNTISKNGCGISLGMSNGNKIFKNSILNNMAKPLPFSPFGGITLLLANDNRIHQNNFIYNIPNAHFWRSYDNTWKNNYWNRPRLSPKLIFGRIGLSEGLIPWINVDWHPAQEPYDLPDV